MATDTKLELFRAKLRQAQEPADYEERLEALVYSGRRAMRKGQEPFDAWIVERLKLRPTPEVRQYAAEFLGAYCEPPVAVKLERPRLPNGLLGEPEPLPAPNLKRDRMTKFWRRPESDDPGGWLGRQVKKRVESRRMDEERKKTRELKAAEAAATLSAGSEGEEADELDAAQVTAALVAAGLTQLERAVCERQLQGESYAEIARALQRTPGHMRMTARRAEKKLKAQRRA